MKVEVVNIQGEATGRSVELPEEAFGIEPNDHAIYLAVKQYLGNQRQGTHKSKERGEIRGSTKKIKKQKGTGTARAGSIKSPIFKGGGRVFGPRPRSYRTKLNKKVRILARHSALSYKARENQVVVIEDFDFEQARTKSYIEMLSSLGLEGKKTLLVLNESKPNVYLSCRNVPKNDVVHLHTLNTYRILNCNTLILSESTVETFGAND